MNDRGSPSGGSGYRLSTTWAYHREDLNTLGWELTVCNSLNPVDTPIRRILKHNASYGHLLYDYLTRFMPLEKITSVLEIGGGYGYLMKDFLMRDSGLNPSMLDISPVLLQKQQETLAGHDVSYVLEDALETDPTIFGRHELAILNENLGDFPTLIDIDPVILEEAPSSAGAAMRTKVRRFFTAYGLEKPREEFNLNIGAMEMVERLCSSGIPYIFIGEHSCEARVPPMLEPYITIRSEGNPRRIPLKGHDEYTIKFSYLQRIAGYHGYNTVRGPFADFITPILTERLKATLATRGLYSDAEETVYHFVGDLHEYEYLIMVKEGYGIKGCLTTTDPLA
jgi:hypothetical protein